MRKAVLLLVVLVLALALAAASTVSASIPQFVGTWRNTNPATPGVTQLVITWDGAHARVHAWGQCHPTDCDWGEVVATAYAPNVSANIYSTALALTAVFNPGFSETIMVIRPASGNRLQAEVLTRFTDGSGRSNYTATYTFTRGGGSSVGLAAPIQVSPPNGSVFSHYPRTTTLKWNPVPGATGYNLEVQYYGAGWENYIMKTNLTTTFYTFDFVGAQPGRWRVWAVGAGGAAGRKSPWWEFKYTI